MIFFWGGGSLGIIGRLKGQFGLIGVQRVRLLCVDVLRQLLFLGLLLMSHWLIGEVHVGLARQTGTKESAGIMGRKTEPKKTQ